MDAAIDEQNQQAGLKLVIRDSNGKIMVAAVKISKQWKEVAYVEVEAMEWGFEVANEVVMFHLIMETDCQEVVNLVNKKKENRIEIFRVISEIQNQCKWFQKVKAQHV